MTIKVIGVLRSPQGTPVQNAEILFEQSRTSTEVVAGTKFSVVTDQQGNYSSSLGIGTFIFKIRFQHETQYQTIASNIIVTPEMDGYTINDIIITQQTLEDIDYDLLKQILEVKNEAVEASLQAKASQIEAKSSQQQASISEQHALTSEQQALDSKNASKQSEDASKQSEISAQQSQQQALSSKNSAQASETVAIEKAQQAQNSQQQALSSENQAQSSKQQALQSERQQQSSQTQASDSQQQAANSEATASLKASQAATSQTNASNSQSAASTKAQDAQASQLAAQGSQTLATDKATQAQSSQSSASTSQTTQTDKAQQSASSAVLAQKWAANPEDVEVSSGLFSAKHYAAKAAQYAQTTSGQLIWRGGWSAQAGTQPPTPQENTQDFYRITQAGTILSVSYDIGDYIHWDTINSIWFKMDGTDSVTSVNGRTGAVVLNKSDVGLPQVNNWGASSQTNDSSTSTYATTAGVKAAYDLAASKLNANATAVAATKLATARTIGGVLFDGTAGIDLPGVNIQGNQNTSGNAATATKLATARTIGGVAFDGTASIDLPGVNTQGNQNTSGNAAAAAKLVTARTIGGVAFDGTADIDLPGVNTVGNQSTTGNAATATKLETPRTIAGVSFDGSANISLNASNVGAVPTTQLLPVSGGTINWADLIGKVPVINSAGLTELGRYLDMREQDANVDFHWRWDAGLAGANKLGLYNSAGSPVIEFNSSGRVKVVTNGLDIGGRAQVAQGVNPMYEWHIPGNTATASYLTTAKDWRFVESNGQGGETNYRFVSLADGRFIARGQVLTDYVTNSTWNGFDTAAFRVNAPRTHGVGVYNKLVSHKLYNAGYWGLENSYGAYLEASSNAWSQLSHTFVSTDGGNTTAIWKMRNDGFLNSPGTWFIPSDGNIYGTRWGAGNYIWEACVATFQQISDIKYKDVVGDSDASALAIVDKFKFKKFYWKQEANREPDLIDIGLIAQEVEQINANFVKTARSYTPEGEVDEETKGLDATALLSLSLKAIQELQAQIDELKVKLDQLT